MNLENMSIVEIREHVSQLDEIPSELIDRLLADPRKGVAAIGRQLSAQAARREREQARWLEMTTYERQLREQGKRLLFGIDEVGRGPLAGPVVACAVALPEDFYLPGLDDSKKVPPVLRQAYYEVILRDALGVGIGAVPAERIDEINILEATREAMRLAVANAGAEPDVCLIDALHIPDLPCEQVPIVGGDGKSVSIAAASIVAKVTRDQLMAEYAKIHPEYGFDKHAGYATEEHLRALEIHGPCPIHRRTFGGVKEKVGQSQSST
ncbi:ribonuclease HII [Brevibacillus humidisoli]|uniref:ribonuclease HII n=1 Tax=Brevibacillus humidisoli TaxID=2895522 RepID=UPI001E4D014B|nr:ribonuclease HII [Brevibacillus humidisoli]UFJ42091.1 ribonuclease HII [Brevibacillus humidisoli]